MRRQLILLGTSTTPRLDRAWGGPVAWLGTCGCSTVTAAAPITQAWFKCNKCREKIVAVPHHDAMVAAYTVGGWPAVIELAVALYVELPA